MRFRTEDVISVATSFLLGRGSEVVRIIRYMAGEEVYDHQLSRVHGECKLALGDRYPGITEVEIPGWVRTQSLADQFIRESLHPVFGEYLEVEPMDGNQHTSIDPYTEACMVFKGYKVTQDDDGQIQVHTRDCDGDC